MVSDSRHIVCKLLCLGALLVASAAPGLARAEPTETPKPAAQTTGTCNRIYRKLASIKEAIYNRTPKGRRHLAFEERERLDGHLMSNYFGVVHHHVLQDGTPIMIPEVSGAERARLRGDVETLLNFQVRMGMRPRSALAELQKWLGQQPFPTPHEFRPGFTLGQYTQAIIERAILENYNEPGAALAALRGNVPEMTWRALKWTLNTVKGSGKWLFSTAVIGVIYATIGDLARSVISYPIQPVQDWLDKFSSQRTGWLQAKIQHAVTGWGTAKVDHTDDDPSGLILLKAKRAATDEIATEAQSAVKAAQARDSASLTDDERQKLWRQLSDRFYKLNFNLDKTFQDNIKNGRGSFENRILENPLNYASRIGVHEVQLDMHEKNIKRLKDELAALTSVGAQQQDGAKIQQLQRELNEHIEGRSFAINALAANLAAWAVVRFIYPETSRERDEVIGKEAFGSSYDRLTRHIGFDVLAKRYADQVAEAVKQLDDRLTLLEKLAPQHKPLGLQKNTKSQ